MNAHGLFFLRTSAYTGRTSADQFTLMLPLIERSVQLGALQDTERARPSITLCVTAHWSGDTAAAFYRQHQTHLRAGCPLWLELDKLRVISGEIHASILRCDPAPSRWPQQAMQQAGTHIDHHQYPDGAAARLAPQQTTTGAHAS